MASEGVEQAAEEVLQVMQNASHVDGRYESPQSKGRNELAGFRRSKTIPHHLKSFNTKRCIL